MSLRGIRSVTVRYGLIHLSSPVTRCHHHRQGSAPSFSNSSQTGAGGGSGVCTLLDDVDEPLLDELPLDDELPDDDDDDDDDVLSSSLSTSRFLRGLSLTPPRRGLSLMPRLSIVYVGRRRMVGMGIGAVRLGCPSWLSRRGCRQAVQGSTGVGAGAWQDGWPTDFPDEMIPRNASPSALDTAVVDACDLTAPRLEDLCCAACAVLTGRYRLGLCSSGWRSQAKLPAPYVAAVLTHTLQAHRIHLVARGIDAARTRRIAPRCITAWRKRPRRTAQEAANQACRHQVHRLQSAAVPLREGKRRRLEAREDLRRAHRQGLYRGGQAALPAVRRAVRPIEALVHGRLAYKVINGKVSMK